MSEDTGVIMSLSAVIVASIGYKPAIYITRDTSNNLKLMGIEENTSVDRKDALPFGPFDPVQHRTLEAGLLSWVDEQTPIKPKYVEQLYTFGNRGRYAGQKKDGPRLVSVGYLALTFDEELRLDNKESWGDWYDYFPWEDWRDGKPEIIDNMIIPSLRRFIENTEDKTQKKDRKSRADLCFCLDNTDHWDNEKVLERYELLYEARLVEEALKDKEMDLSKSDYIKSHAMQYDHRRILATAIGRLRGKLKYRPVVFELLPSEFTLFQLQKTVEAIMGQKLHKQNFRRLVENLKLVEDTGKMSSKTGGRPAALFKFRTEVLLERNQLNLAS